MKFTVLVLGGTCQIGNLINIDLPFEELFDPVTVESNLDLPNLIIKHGKFDNTLKFKNKTIPIKTELTDYLFNQLRSASDIDVIGLYDWSDNLYFTYPLLEGMELEIIYNVKKKIINNFTSDVLVIVDNTLSQNDSTMYIENLLKNEAKRKFVLTTNSDLQLTGKCEVEYIKC